MGQDLCRFRPWEMQLIKCGLKELIELLGPDKPVNALTGPILLVSRLNMVGVYIGTSSRSSSFMGDVAL